MITIDWRPPLDKLMAEHAAKMPYVIRDMLLRLGVMGESKMKQLTPVDTGNLRKRISHTMPNVNEVHIGTNVSYAPFILLDVKPFTIRARRKKALAWVTKGHIRPSTPAGWKEARKRGWARYAKQVTHPGGVNALGRTEEYLETRIPQVAASILKKYGVT